MHRIVTFLAALLVLAVSGCAADIYRQDSDIDRPHVTVREPVQPAPGANFVIRDAKGLRRSVRKLEDQSIVIYHVTPVYLAQTATACTPGRTMRVWWSKITVCRTPNDAGSYEEWKSRISAGTPTKHVVMKRRHNPPDNLSLSLNNPLTTCWNHWVNKKRYFNEIGSVIPWVYAHHYGHESDAWPNPDDDIPNYIDIKPFDNCVGNYTWISECGWDDAYRRYSCTSVQFYTY